MSTITKDKINILRDYCKNKKEIVILGSGPSFKTVEPSDDKLIICINHTIYLQKKCDVYFCADKNMFDKIITHFDHINNIKFIIFSNPLHNMGIIDKKYGYNYVYSELKKKGYINYIIPWNAIPSDIPYGYYDCVNKNWLNENNQYITLNLNYYQSIIKHIRFYPDHIIVPTIFIYRFLMQFDSSKKKDVINENNYSLHYYGVGVLDKINPRSRTHNKFLLSECEKKNCPMKKKPLGIHTKEFTLALHQCLNYYSHILPYYIN